MVDVGFQSENIVAQVVEVLANFLQATYDDNKDNIIQMANETSQSTNISPQLMHQRQQMQILMAQTQTQLNNTNKIVETTTTLVVVTRASSYQFVDNYTAGLMVHAITRKLVVGPRQKARKTMQLSINYSTGAITIGIIMIIITRPGDVVHTVK